MDIHYYGWQTFIIHQQVPSMTWIIWGTSLRHFPSKLPSLSESRLDQLGMNEILRPSDPAGWGLELYN